VVFDRARRLVLEAVEGRLKAAEGGLKAAENGLKAAEGGLKAAENGLKAAEGGLKAAESRLKPAGRGRAQRPPIGPQVGNLSHTVSGRLKPAGPGPGSAPNRPAGWQPVPHSFRRCRMIEHLRAVTELA